MWPVAGATCSSSTSLAIWCTSAPSTARGQLRRKRRPSATVATRVCNDTDTGSGVACRTRVLPVDLQRKKNCRFLSHFCYFLLKMCSWLAPLRGLQCAPTPPCPPPPPPRPTAACCAACGSFANSIPPS